MNWVVSNLHAETCRLWVRGLRDRHVLDTQHVGQKQHNNQETKYICTSARFSALHEDWRWIFFVTPTLWNDFWMELLSQSCAGKGDHMISDFLLWFIVAESLQDLQNRKVIWNDFEGVRSAPWKWFWKFWTKWYWMIFGVNSERFWMVGSSQMNLELKMILEDQNYIKWIGPKTWFWEIGSQLRNWHSCCPLLGWGSNAENAWKRFKR